MGYNGKVIDRRGSKAPDRIPHVKPRTVGEIRERIAKDLNKVECKEYSVQDTQTDELVCGYVFTTPSALLLPPGARLDDDARHVFQHAFRTSLRAATLGVIDLLSNDAGRADRATKLFDALRSYGGEEQNEENTQLSTCAVDADHGGDGADETDE